VPLGDVEELGAVVGSSSLPGGDVGCGPEAEGRGVLPGGGAPGVGVAPGGGVGVGATVGRGVGLGVGGGVGAGVGVGASVTVTLSGTVNGGGCEPSWPVAWNDTCQIPTGRRDDPAHVPLFAEPLTLTRSIVTLPTCAQTSSARSLGSEL